jgi:diguanylate cyclase (GGDEF)-like protein/PAS domain S-box-containing protein
MHASKAELKRIFPGDSEMAQRMREFDWAQTVVGPVQYWPQSLKTALGMMLNSRYPMFVWWGEQRTNFYNDAYIPVLGKRHPEALGLPASQVWHEIWDQLGAQSAQVLTEAEAIWCDQVLLVMERNGFTEETYFTYSYSPIPDDSGNTGGVLCVCSEETQRVLSQRRLHTLQALGETATARTAQAACSMAAATLANYPQDLPFVLLYLLGDDVRNARLAGCTCLNSESAATPDCIEIGSAEAAWPLHQCIASGALIEIDDLHERFGDLHGGCWPEPTQKAVILPLAKSGQDEVSGFVVVGVSPRLVFDDNYRAFLQLLSGHIATSVTNAEAYEAERKHVTALAELNQAKTTFFSNISHELRTPLTLLLGPADDLLEERHGMLPADAQQQVSIIQRNALRLQKLVNTLLDFSRMEAGRVQAQYAPTDLARLTGELASVFRSAIEKADMQLIVDCPALAQPVYVDSSMWEKIVLNLLSNAFKYSLQGEIRVTLRQEQQAAVLQVSDTGIGIAESELPKLFNRFYRIKGARGRSEEGTGIGLAMVLELAKLHGGIATVQSNQGKGSTFTVIVPLGRDHLPAEHVSDTTQTAYAASSATAIIEEISQWTGMDGHEEQTTALEPSQSSADISTGEAKPTVLIADDNADMRGYLCRLLRNEYHVLSAANGQQALQLARTHQPDLLLSDVMMPGLDGFELLSTLRQQPALTTMAVILLSARAGEEARIEGLQAGADDYLTKPFNARELLARVHGMVALSRARREAHDHERRMREEAEKLNRLHALSNRLLAAPTLQDALSEVLNACIDMLGAVMGNVQLYDEAAGSLQLLVHRGFDQQFLSHFKRVGKDEHTVCAEALRRRERVVVEDIRTAPGFEHLRKIAAQAGYCAVQSTPLLNRDGKVLGVISTHFAGSHQPSEQELRLLDLYVNQAVDLLERLRMAEALQQSKHRLKHELEAMNHLHALSNRLLAAPDLQNALEEVLDASLLLLGSTMGSVQLYNPQKGTLKLFAYRGFNSKFLEFFSEFDSRLGTPCSIAFHAAERVITENIRNDPRFINSRGRASDAGFFGVQATPLVNRKGEVLGVISTHFHAPHRPSEQELRMLDIYARQSVDLIERIGVEDALRANEAKFRALAEASPALIWQLDEQGNLVYVNNRYRSMLGLVPEDVLGTNWHHVLQPENAAENLADLARSRHEQTPFHKRIDMQAKDGSLVILDAHALPWFDAEGRFAGHIGISVDITENVQAQQDLYISNERLKLAMEGSGDGIWDWDMPTSRIVYSERFEEILGFAEGELDNSYEEWQSRVHPEDIARVLAALESCLEDVLPAFVCEYRLLSKQRKWKWVLSRAIVVSRDSSGKAQRMTGTLSDISEKKRMDETIWQHANFDTLTGLPNRRLFRDRLGQELKKSQRTGLPVALFFIDLDQFKEVNDLLGHDIGDLLLVEAARRIRASVRETDTVGRLGGDEFTAILTELDDVTQVERIAQKIIATLSEPFRLGNEVLYLSASLGITMYPADADNAEKLIRNADQAMYAAKSAGRNQFNYFTRSMQERAHARLRLIGDLRNALSHNQLKVYYQPVVDLQTGNIVKAEALLRWQHPQLGFVEPLQFITLAEESGLIHEIGNWIFKEAALRSQQWSAQIGMPFQISVNKSPVQFISQNRDLNWARHMQATDMQSSSISIEITEGLLLNASPGVIDKLLQYRDAGIQVAIDDFGTGYSSMAYLKKFDIDYLKIDQSFIADMAHDRGNLTIVKSVIVMAHELGLKVIAEGIESEEQRLLLINAGCDFGQGYLFSAALPANEFEVLLLTDSSNRRPSNAISNVYKNYVA